MTTPGMVLGRAHDSAMYPAASSEPFPSADWPSSVLPSWDPGVCQCLLPPDVRQTNPGRRKSSSSGPFLGRVNHVPTNGDKCKVPTAHRRPCGNNVELRQKLFRVLPKVDFQQRISSIRKNKSASGCSLSSGPASQWYMVSTASSSIVDAVTRVPAGNSALPPAPSSHNDGMETRVQPYAYAAEQGRHQEKPVEFKCFIKAAATRR